MFPCIYVFSMRFPKIVSCFSHGFSRNSSLAFDGALEETLVSIGRAFRVLLRSATQTETRTIVCYWIQKKKQVEENNSCKSFQF